MPENPLENIENDKAMHDMGVMAVGVYTGALEASEGNPYQAFIATAAYFSGMFHGPTPEKDEDAN